MKLILTICNLSLGVLTALAAGGAGILALAGGGNTSPQTAWGYFGIGTLHLLLFSGLLISVTVTFAGLIATALGFIFKSWLRAAVSFALSAACAALWQFFLRYSL